MDKLLNSAQVSETLTQNYMVSLSESLVMILGAVQLVISIFFILGSYKTIVYGLGLITEIIILMPELKYLFQPFSEHQIIIYHLPIITSFFILFLLRTSDIKWSLNKKKSLFAG